MIEYVLKVTGQKKLFYVGHSQGTIMGFAGFTFNPELAKHIQVFFALAPVTTVKHLKGLFRVIADYRSIVEVREVAGWTLALVGGSQGHRSHLRHEGESGKGESVFRVCCCFLLH